VTKLKKNFAQLQTFFTSRSHNTIFFCLVQHNIFHYAFAWNQVKKPAVFFDDIQTHKPTTNFLLKFSLCDFLLSISQHNFLWNCENCEILGYVY